MSRDFAPQEMYHVDKNLDVRKMSIIDMNGNIVYDPDSWVGRHFPMSWLLAAGVIEAYLKEYVEKFSGMYPYSNILGGVDALCYMEQQISFLIEEEEGEGNPRLSSEIDSVIRKWFIGHLDKNFYYHETNDRLLVEYLLEKFPPVPKKEVRKREEEERSMYE